MPTSTSSDENTPLLHGMADLEALNDASQHNPHRQFCLVAGVPPSNQDAQHFTTNRTSLYSRATRAQSTASWSHAFMASFSNTLLLSQVVLGATLTALGASESSHILITIFGVINTIIAGLVAYLKSRGQPMRARMYRDDLKRVVNEIEDSEVMWLGITKGVHGYDEIDVGNKVTVRSEVARLMRVYERAVKANMLNNPDNYPMGMGPDSAGTALRARPNHDAGVAPAGMPAVGAELPVVAAPAAPAPAVEDPDQSPASAPPKPSKSPPLQVMQHSGQTPGKDAAEDSKAGVKDGKAAEEAAKGDHSAPGADAQPGGNAASSKSTPHLDPDVAPASSDAVLKKKADDEGEDHEEPLPHTGDADGNAGP